ncbi:MAG: cyclic nucleotide-binding domain-containing protein [Rubrivivax sp.]|nr:cyclic nucleotide-binding domain-containing protein [Rubrivivax sp.]
MTRGDTIGDVSLLTGEPRAATVRATRDSVVVRLAHEAIDGVMRQHGSMGAAMARRPRAAPLRASNRARPIARRFQCIALIQHFRPCRRASRRRWSRPSAADAEEGDRPRRRGDRRVRGRARGRGLRSPRSRSRRGFGSLEDEHRFVLLLGGPEADAWTRLAMRRADAVLVIADAAAAPTPCAAERAHERHVARASTSANAALAATVDAQRVELVLLQPAGRAPSGTGAWYTERRLHAHRPSRAHRAGTSRRTT